MSDLSLIVASGSGSAASLFRDLLPWLILLTVFVIVGAVVLAWLRRMARDVDGTLGGEAFTLQQLRDMHESGLLSDDEFEHARQEMIGRLRGDSGRAAPTAKKDHSPPPSPRDDR